MNNKGQSLTIFIIIIPIIFTVFAFTIDYAYIIYNQQKYENISKNILESTTDLSYYSLRIYGICSDCQNNKEK